LRTSKATFPVSAGRATLTPASRQVVRVKVGPLLAVAWAALTMSMLSQPSAVAGPG
jgi:hypothetical protein